MDKLKDFFTIIKKFSQKNMLMPKSLFYLTGLCVFILLLFSSYIDTLKNNFGLFLLVSELIILIYLLYYNYLILGSKKDEIKLYILLYGDNKNKKDYDEIVCEIHKHFISILSNDPNSKIRIIKPNFCIRKNYSRFLKNLSYRDDVSDSLLYKILKKIWKADIVVYGEVTQKKGENKVQIENRCILINNKFDELAKKNNIKGIPNYKIIGDDKHNQYFFIDDKYDDLFHASEIIEYIAKYYLGIILAFKNEIYEAFDNHFYLLCKPTKIRNNFEGLVDIVNTELTYIINILIEKKQYLEGIKYIEKIEKTNTFPKELAISKAQLIMYNANTKKEFNEACKTSNELIKNIKKEGNVILSRAYLLICRGLYKEPNVCYRNYYKNNSRDIKDYDAIIKYCNVGLEKNFESDISAYCLASINYYCYNYDKAYEYSSRITDLNMIKNISHIENESKIKIEKNSSL